MVTENVAYIGEWWTSRILNVQLYQFHNVSNNDNEYSIFLEQHNDL